MTEAMKYDSGCRVRKESITIPEIFPSGTIGWIQTDRDETVKVLESALSLINELYKGESNIHIDAIARHIDQLKGK